MREPDAAFADPRQAALYDVFDDDRSDVDAYVAIAVKIDARRVIDVGCGTGSLAVRLAGDGLSVVGVDPAGVSPVWPRPSRSAVWSRGSTVTPPISLTFFRPQTWP